MTVRSVRPEQPVSWRYLLNVMSNRGVDPLSLKALCLIVKVPVPRPGDQYDAIPGGLDGTLAMYDGLKTYGAILNTHYTPAFREAVATVLKHRLNMLGTTAVQVAASLVAHGCVGRRGNGRECPVALFTANITGYPFAFATSSTIKYGAGVLKTPYPVADFIRAFDGDEYEELSS